MGQLELKSSTCAKAPSQDSGAARDRMQVKITISFSFSLLFFLLLNIFPTGSRSISQNGFQAQKSSFLPDMVNSHTQNATVWAPNTRTEGAKGGLTYYSHHIKTPYFSCSRLLSLGLMAVLSGDSFEHLPTMWLLSLAILNKCWLTACHVQTWCYDWITNSPRSSPTKNFHICHTAFYGSTENM